MATQDPLRREGEDQSEGLAGTNRTQLARGLILAAAFVSFVFSVALWFSGSEGEGVFVGIWVPTILSLGAFLLPREAS